MARQKKEEVKETKNFNPGPEVNIEDGEGTTTEKVTKTESPVISETIEDGDKPTEKTPTERLSTTTTSVKKFGPLENTGPALRADDDVKDVDDDEPEDRQD